MRVRPSPRLLVFLALALLAWIVPGVAQTLPRVQSRYFITSDGVRLHYLDAGPRGAKILLFVPGWTMPAWIWAPQIAAFSRQYHVVAFDPRGQGDSDAPATGYEPVRRGQDIADLITHLAPVPVVVVGWSLGVLDTLAYVHTHGDALIAGLVLVDNSVGEDPAPVPVPPPAAPRAAATVACGGDAAVRPGHVPPAAKRRLSGPAHRGDTAHAGIRLPRAAVLPRAAHLLARGDLFHRQAGALRRAPRLRGAGGEPAKQAAEYRDRIVRRCRPCAVRR